MPDKFPEKPFTFLDLFLIAVAGALLAVALLTLWKAATTEGIWLPTDLFLH